MSHINRSLMLTYWDVLQVKHACFDIPARRNTSPDLWRCKRSLSSRSPNSYVEYFLWSAVWIFKLLNFTCKSISICSPVLCNCEDYGLCACGEQYQKFKVFLSAILMRVCSNIDGRIARLMYKQSEIIVFDEWTKGGLYMCIAGVSCGLGLLLKRCERKCRTEFLAKLTGQGLSTL